MHAITMAKNVWTFNNAHHIGKNFNAIITS
ncbi:hypothetical protein SAMN05444360_107207 [Chryseobacterium carnipullorum]|nr:hypothetical protein SAMN05444360_107207 [Chryseobacterium carnipullorum]